MNALDLTFCFWANASVIACCFVCKDVECDKCCEEMCCCSNKNNYDQI